MCRVKRNKGGKWDNCNSIINKIYFLKIGGSFSLRSREKKRSSNRDKEDATGEETTRMQSCQRHREEDFQQGRFLQCPILLNCERR